MECFLQHWHVMIITVRFALKSRASLSVPPNDKPVRSSDYDIKMDSDCTAAMKV